MPGTRRLGVLDSDKRELERFLFVGIDEQTRAEIGPLPRGHGILGELIRNPEPLRLRRISDHPRSYGFPSGHPGDDHLRRRPGDVPRRGLRQPLPVGEGRTGPSSTSATSGYLVVLAEWAAIAIENARIYEAAERGRTELERAARGLQATASLSRELSGETDMERVVELIVKRGRALVDARTLLFVTPSGDEYVGRGLRRRVGGRSPRAAAIPPRDPRSTMRFARGARSGFDGDEMRWFAGAGIDAAGGAARADAPGSDERGGPDRSRPRRTSSRSARDDELVLASFATSAAAAIATGRALESDRLQLSIDASERERRRWARELHDETMQELGALKVMQESALRRTTRPCFGERSRTLPSTSGRVIDNLEALITELRPASLDQLGSQAAIEALVEQMSERSGLEIADRLRPRV